jgi:hypothetical protein
MFLQHRQYIGNDRRTPSGAGAKQEVTCAYNQEGLMLKFHAESATNSKC